MRHMMLCLIMRSLEVMEKPCSVADPRAGVGLCSEHPVFASKNRSPGLE